MEKLTVKEAKSYKMLAEIRGQLISVILSKCRHALAYWPDDAEELKKLITSIADPSKWEYHGILKNEEIGYLKIIEFILDDNRSELTRFYDGI